MEKEKTLDCLCLKSIDYKENDKLVTLYAFGEGKVTAVLKGVKKSKAKLPYAGALFCFGKYYLAGRNGYYSVIGCDLVDNFYDVWTDIDKYYAALCGLEILDRAADDREIGDKIAAITLDFINEVCYKSTNIMLSLTLYLNNVNNCLGYSILPACINCGDNDSTHMYYSFLRSGVVCNDCKEYNAMRLTKNAVGILDKLYNKLPIDSKCESKDLILLIRIYSDILGKNLAKKFKTLEEYNLFYNKLIFYNKNT